MVSDSVMVDRLQEILRVSDLETTTASTLRRKLEEEFGVDLSDRKAFIREQIDIFLRTHVEGHSNDDVKHEQEPENVKEEEIQDSCFQEEESENVKEVDNDDSQEGENKSVTRPKKKARFIKIDGEAKKKGNFNKPYALSPQLQKLVGESKLGRPEVVKKIWAYIREKNLQNPENKRRILCDDVLTGIFRVKTIDMFRMNKVLSKHIWPVEEEDASQVKLSTKRRLPKQSRKEALDEPKKKVKREKGGGSGFLAPIRLSDALVKFFGNGENALPRADVVKKIWQYIKENELQDPSDKKTVICDERLKELFQVDSFHGFTVTKLLTTHFIKKGD